MSTLTADDGPPEIRSRLPDVRNVPPPADGQEARSAQLKCRFRQMYGSSGRIALDMVRRLLSQGLSSPEVEAIVQSVHKDPDDTVDFDELVDFVFAAGARKPAGNAVHAVRSLRSKQDDAGDAGKETSTETSSTDIPSATLSTATGGEMSPCSPEPSVPGPPSEVTRQRTMSPTSALAASQKECPPSPKGSEKDRFNICHGHEKRKWAKPVSLNRALVQEFMNLDQHGKVQAEYVWIDSDYTDGENFDLCSKSLTLASAPGSLADVPTWSYSAEEDGFPLEAILVPRRVYQDPFRKGGNIVVLTDCYQQPREGSGERRGGPVSWNTRARCVDLMEKALSQGHEPWFGIEQEFYLVDESTSWPLGWPEGGYPGPQGAYFCATGSVKSPGREIVEAHYRACLHAGVAIGGINSEVAPGQWEFQVGPCVGMQAVDDLWMARYLLQRTCELFHVNVTFDPKPVPGWAGIGCHTNYSTVGTRSPGGFKEIQKHCELLRKRHMDHMEVYGKDNERRLVGNDETESMHRFSSGVGDRSASIRIPVRAASEGCGYYEDRRPAANMDPYLVAAIIVETTLFSEELEDSQEESPSEALGSPA